MKKIVILLGIVAFFSFFRLNAQTIYYWDTLDFETPYPYLSIDTASENLWQIGEPQKTIFNSAFAGTHAIVTDTLLNYPINNTSEFIIAFGDFNFSGFYPMVVFFEIIHKYDTDTLKDGGFISISFDMGQTWTNIIEDYSSIAVTPADTVYGSENLYNSGDTLFNGEFGFSGRNNGWDTCWFTWHGWLLRDNMNFSDTALLKFSFISDGIDTGKEGWMIDNIKLYSDMSQIGGLNDFDQASISIYPNPANEYMEVNINQKGEKWVASIYDFSGRVLFTHQYNSQSALINLSEFKNGAYILETRLNNSDIANRKVFVVNK